MSNSGPLAADQQCDGCAFGPACEGREEVLNRLRSEIHVLGAVPFYCHHSRSGAEYDWRDPASLGPLQLKPAERRLCSGWKAAVALAYRRGGPFDFIRGSDSDAVGLRRYQRMLGSIASAQLDDFLEEKDPALRLTKLRALEDSVRALKPAEALDGK